MTDLHARTIDILRKLCDDMDQYTVHYGTVSDARELLALHDAQGTAPAVQQEAVGWMDGEPPMPWRNEWFIAQTIRDDRVVLRALPEEYTYDYKTADETYFKASFIKRWMQFPDSSYTAPASQPARVVEWQPIESAPKDGRCLLGNMRGHMRVIYWDNFHFDDDPPDGWKISGTHYPCSPTEWMSLPTPPAQEKGE